MKIKKIYVVVLFLLVVIALLALKNKQLNKSLNTATSSTAIVWQYFGDDWGLNNFVLKYPHGWTVDNVNRPRQYVFESPDIQKKSLAGRLQILKGAWISLNIDSAFGKDLESVKKEIGKMQGNEIQKGRLLDQEAIWYKDRDASTFEDRINLVTVKNGMQYSLLLVYNSNESKTENFYTVFNGIADSLTDNKK